MRATLIFCRRSGRPVRKAAACGERCHVERRELYRSPEGEAWFLGRDPSSGLAVVIHESTRPSGEDATLIDLRTFFASAPGPEQQALLRLIGTLVNVPPYA